MTEIAGSMTGPEAVAPVQHATVRIKDDRLKETSPHRRKTGRRYIRARAVWGVGLCNRSLAQRMGEAIWRRKSFLFCRG
jgi:hypothetical protein